MNQHIVDWDLDIDAELEKLSSSRSRTWNYELRHPGHGDQSVHNPHKGGGAYAPGAWKPVSKAQLEAMDSKVEGDIAKWNPRNQMLAVDKYRRERVKGDTYSNGSVVVRFPARNGLTKDQQKAVLDDIDSTAKFAPEGMFSDPGFPIEISVGARMSSRRDGEWAGSPQNGGRMGIRASSQLDRSVTTSDLGDSLSPINTGVFAKQSVYPKSVPFHPQATQSQSWASSVVAHELGHVAEDFNRRSGTGAGLPSNAFGFISGYAKKNGSERYAEHFAAWVAGATDSLTTKVAQDNGWRKP